MNVSLTKELEGFVESLVAGGMYYSASEVVRDGLRLLKEQQDLKSLRAAELRREIMLGAEDIKAGRHTVYSSDEDLDKLGEEIKARGMERLAKRKNGK